jgi:hypothetical protein
MTQVEIFYSIVNYTSTVFALDLSTILTLVKVVEVVEVFPKFDYNS